MKVKIFQGFIDVEKAINEWFEENPNIEVKFTNATEAVGKNQYSSEHKQSVYIFYEEKISLI